MFIALAFIFQSTPVFLPIAGLLLSPLSTLPIILATYFRISLGMITYIATAFLLTFVSIQESIIFIFTTGLLGLTIGAYLFRKTMVLSIFISSVALFLGIMTLTFGVGVAAFGERTHRFSIPTISVIFGVFSFIYASLWNFIVKRFIVYLKKINIFRV